jgi:lipoic acid synthetase
MARERRLPEWLKVKMPGGSNYLAVRELLQGHELHTVCEEAHCPNIGECWDRGTATFMVLGDICTRACSYCAVTTGRPTTYDLEEPARLAETVEMMGLQYAVITSVNRDDLPDGGAYIFSQCIRQIRKRTPDCRVEVLIPDFQGNWDALATVMAERPDTLNHNIETVRRVFHQVRPKGDFDQSLELLAKAKELVPDGVTKSGMMVGLGETFDEIVELMHELRAVDCDLMTIGQYLRPSDSHVPLAKWYTPQEFDELRHEGLALGFKDVASGPLVRSSFYADKQHDAARGGLVPA